MISLDNLTVSYGGWTLFDNISFLINPKDRIGLVGRNGAGKTTLLRIITGEQQPTSGAVTLNGDCTIGYLPQTMRVADTTTLAEEAAELTFEKIAATANPSPWSRSTRCTRPEASAPGAPGSSATEVWLASTATRRPRSSG